MFSLNFDTFLKVSILCFSQLSDLPIPKKDRKAKMRFAEVEDRLVLIRIVEHTLEKCNFTEVLVNNRIIHCFNKQICRLMEATNIKPLPNKEELP